MRIRRLLVALLVVSSARCYAAMDTVIPLPKEIRAVGKPVPLDGFGIAAADDERSLIGAAEINQRIVSLGGQPLPVSRFEGTSTGRQVDRRGPLYGRSTRGRDTAAGSDVCQAGPSGVCDPADWKQG